MAEPIVSVEQGKLKGKVCVDYDGGKFYSFQGIPYGKPPIGQLRFKAPLPAEPWTGVRDATVEGSESVSKHMIFSNDVGSEDCLHLNVYTPQLPSPSGAKPLKPVMVWIHGGGFVAGSSKTEFYGPEFLITEDIVLVSFNYRLGLLGFMSFEDTSLGVPGNAGLKDMVLALKWVQKNIAQFNGDPNNVTIFGESAGSAAVHFLTLSPLTKGLFHRAIMQSGCTLNPWVIGSCDPKKVVKVFGYEGKDDKDVLNFLQSVPSEKFLVAQNLIQDELFVDVTRPYCPVIEKPHEGAFITKDPIDIMLSGDYNKVPMMIGYTDREGMLVDTWNKLNGVQVKYRLDDFERAIPKYYKIPKGTELSKNVAGQIEKFYYGDSQPGEGDVDKFYVMQSDAFFTRGILVTLRSILKTINNPVYLYRMTLETSLNFYKKVGNITSPGASHADDLGYLFKTMITPEFEKNSLEDKSIRRFVKLWTSFAKTGNPNPVQKDPLITVVWPAVKPDDIKCLNIGEELTVVNNPESKMMEFWDNIAAMNGVNSRL